MLNSASPENYQVQHSCIPNATEGMHPAFRARVGRAGRLQGPSRIPSRNAAIYSL